MPQTCEPSDGVATPFMTARQELPRALNVLGERITVLADAARTGGLELFRQQGDVGQGPPPHAHDWNETFYIVAGEIELGAGDVKRLLGPGAVAHVPAGVTHWFRFVTEGEMISVTSRGGATQLFTDLDAAAQAGPPDLAAIIPIAVRNGVTLGGQEGTA